MTAPRRPRIPKLQHLARLWRPSPQATAKQIVSVVDAKIPFNYLALDKLLVQIVRLGISFEQVEQFIKAKEKRLVFQKNLLGIARLMHTHYSSLQPSYVVDLPSLPFTFAQNEFIYFDPKFGFGVDNDLRIEWQCYWSDFALSGENLALFATIFRSVMADDPDIEEAAVFINDYSRSGDNSERELTQLPLESLPTLRDAELKEMLSIFSEGFEIASKELASRSQKKDKKPNQQSDRSDDHPGLFD